MMYLCLFLLQRTQDRCSTYEECARCEKGLQSSDTDCNQLRDEQGCITILYTNDTAPSKYIHVQTYRYVVHAYWHLLVMHITENLIVLLYTHVLVFSLHNTVLNNLMG